MSKFHDEFLNKGSPEHDKLMIQCTSKNGIRHIINNIDTDGYISITCLKHLIQRSFNDCVSFDTPTTDFNYETEVIARNGTFIIGYADAVIKLGLAGSLEFTDGTLSTYEVSLRILVEAKPMINSIGEVIRQLKTYKSILGPYDPMVMVIVTYTELDADALAYLKNEGIYVVVFPRP
jgi:hypothetical protein